MKRTEKQKAIIELMDLIFKAHDIIDENEITIGDMAEIINKSVAEGVEMLAISTRMISESAWMVVKEREE